MIVLRDATLNDLPALLDLHNYAVRHLAAIWTEHEETLEERRAWFEGRVGNGLPVIVALDENEELLGYASYGPYRPKEGYRLTVEHSVYVFEKAQGQGVGRALMQEIIDIARDKGYHAMVAGVEAKNAPSISLHERFGFKSIGIMPEVGQKHGRWLDLNLMMLLLDDNPVPPSN